MEDVVKSHMSTPDFQTRRVFITGHTGFKGAWLAHWLLQLGADVTGYSLAPPTSPALFDQLGLTERMHSVCGDIRNQTELVSALKASRPEFVFHLAAQSLVRRSYADPLESFSTNALGTATVLESVQTLGIPCTVVAVTSDKCYRNQEWAYGYRETDRLGGIDPYSCSKAMAELVVDSYCQRWFQAANDGLPRVRVASVRAGNVIGGGDWAEDRLVPDAIRALSRQQSIEVRNPASFRPWQHVLEPLFGYLQLACKIDACTDRDALEKLCSPFNFGPLPESQQRVESIVSGVLRHWPGDWHTVPSESQQHEANVLKLCSDKATQVLGWTCRWSFDEMIQRTVEWYRRVDSGEDPKAVCSEQIQQYTASQ